MVNTSGWTVPVAVSSLIALILLIGPATAAHAKEVLTNESVISLVNAGLPESVIVAKVQSSQNNFDTSAEALINLRRSGVPDRVLEAMLRQSGTSAPSPTLSPATPPLTDAVRGGVTVYHLAEGNVIELKLSTSQVQRSSGFATVKTELVIPGRRAQYRMRDRQPVFFSSYSPETLQLVKLEPGKRKDDRNLRIATRGGHPLIGSTQEHGLRSQDRVATDAERDARGWYKIKPREPLPPGEYAFVPFYGATATTGRLYDFGVD